MMKTKFHLLMYSKKNELNQPIKNDLINLPKNSGLAHASISPSSVSFNLNNVQSSYIKDQSIPNGSIKNAIFSQIKLGEPVTPPHSPKIKKSTPPPPFKKYLEEKMHPENFIFFPANAPHNSENLQEYSDFNFRKDKE